MSPLTAAGTLMAMGNFSAIASVNTVMPSPLIMGTTNDVSGQNVQEAFQAYP